MPGRTARANHRAASAAAAGQASLWDDALDHGDHGDHSPKAAG
jgi:hypothetical protein